MDKKQDSTKSSPAYSSLMSSQNIHVDSENLSQCFYIAREAYKSTLEC